MSRPSLTLDPERRAGYTALFFSSVRSSCAQHEHFGWTREQAERTLAACDRIEQLGPAAAYLLVELCCAGREPLTFEAAVATVESIWHPAAP